MNIILIIWCGDEDTDECETYCHMDWDKGSYAVMKYDITSYIMLWTVGNL